MTRQETEQQIANDLNLCNLVEAIGNKSAKAKSAKQRKACMKQIAAWNKEDGLNLSDDEILADLL